MSKTYELTSLRFNGKVTFKYDLKGYLTMMHIDAELEETQHRFLLEKLPIAQPHLMAMKSTTMTVTELPEVIKVPTFDDFWNAYDYKVGGRAKTEVVWNKLNDADKVKSVSAIGAYNTYLLRKNIEKVYPIRFLKDKRFEDDFKKL